MNRSLGSGIIVYCLEVLEHSEVAMGRSPRVNKQGWRRRFPPKLYLVKMLSTVTVSSASSNAKVSTGPNRMISALIDARQPCNVMVDIAAADIDQVISRPKDRAVADRYYGLLCWC